MTYRLNAWVKDKNGKSHLFDGEITINYNDGKPVTATFKGYYDGNYYDGVGIIFYINGDPNYSSFEKGSKYNLRGFIRIFENRIRIK